jgi:hypothetical protein
MPQAAKTRNALNQSLLARFFYEPQRAPGVAREIVDFPSTRQRRDDSQPVFRHYCRTAPPTYFLDRIAAEFHHAEPGEKMASCCFCVE